MFLTHSISARVSLHPNHVPLYECYWESSFVGGVMERKNGLRRLESHDQGSALTLVMLLRPWMRRFAMTL